MFVGRSIATPTPPAFPFRVLYSSQPRFHGFRLPEASKLCSLASMLFNNLPINEELIEILDEIPRQLD